ncbi:type II toxin-antitoxin system prevent-host-death family antitoxin [Candidatus Saccharibacteria bacterium CG_4_10_14_0_2_um_filter_52_9]|nr:MAG: type II toxin-antitoxin system prevent-host-death family antitoxin [Candidatus Saccharibacteria bacterium CG_4_10_14_0_2_um_filter_52_9]
MNVTSISEFRKNTKQYLDQLIDDQDILVIARNGGQSVVMMPLDHYNGMTETEYLLSNPANAKRLIKSLADAKAGKVFKRELIEP